MTHDDSGVAAVLDAAASAVARGATRCLDLCVAGARLRLSVAGDALGEAILPALAPRCEPPRRDLRPDACIDAFDGGGRGDLAPPPPCAALGLDSNAPRSGGRAAFNAGSGVLVACDRGRRRGAWWCRDARLLPPWERAAPMRALLAWLLADLGTTVVHGAAVAIDGAALLLAGPGGAGKSTTALRCLAAGFEYLGDNNAAIGVDPEPMVHSLYASASLRRSSRIRVEGAVEPGAPEDDGSEKVFSMPGARWPDRFPASRPLAAIVVPRVAGADRPRLLPCSEGAALRALAPSTLFAQPGSDARDLSRLSALVRRLPRATLDLADDGAEIVRLLRSLRPAPVVGAGR